MAAAIDASAQTPETVTFRSLDNETNLTAYLLRPPGDEPRAALVMMHGCSGLMGKSGRIFALYRAWMRALSETSYVVLVVDSAASRGFGETCTASLARRSQWKNRPKDAYAALAFLQAQPYVRGDRVGLMGWSQGGGVVLLSVNDKSKGRPPSLTNDFAAAVAFYPGSCSEAWQSKPYTEVEPQRWTTRVPVLVLHGVADNWTPFAPCRDFIEAARARGNPVAIHGYDSAHHAFDIPNLPLRDLTEYQPFNGPAPTIGTNKAARDDAFRRVPKFLQEHLLR